MLLTDHRGMSSRPPPRRIPTPGNKYVTNGLRIRDKLRNLNGAFIARSRHSSHSSNSKPSIASSAAMSCGVAAALSESAARSNGATADVKPGPVPANISEFSIGLGPARGDGLHFSSECSEMFLYQAQRGGRARHGTPRPPRPPRRRAPEAERQVWAVTTCTLSVYIPIDCTQRWVACGLTGAA